CEFLPPIVVVAVLAGEIELTLPRRIELAPRLDERRDFLVIADRNGHAARLPADIGGEREQVTALIRERRGVLLPGAAEVDCLLEVALPACSRADRRIACGHAAHRCLRIAVTVRASLAPVTGLAFPQRFA